MYLFFTLQLEHLTSFCGTQLKKFLKVRAQTVTKIFKSFLNVGAFDNLKWRRRIIGILFSWLFHWINWNILKILSDANIVMIDISHSQMTFMITTFDSDKFLLIANIFVTVTIKGLLVQLVQKSKYLPFEFSPSNCLTLIFGLRFWIEVATTITFLHVRSHDMFDHLLLYGGGEQRE